MLRKYDLLKLDPGTAASQVRRNGKLLLGTSEGQFDLQLAPYDIRSQDYAAQVIGADGVPHKLMRTPVNTYKGQVKGHPRAQARMTIENDTLEGVIIMEGERYFLQPARALSKASREDEFVFYKGSDVIKEAGECGVTLADEVAAEEERARASANAEGTANSTAPSSIVASEITGLSPLKVVRLVTDTDAEYVTALGGVAQANNQILSIMNQVDGIYQVEIGVKFEIVFQNNWSDAATDPYISTASGTLLGEFRAHWNTTPPNPTPRDLAHLWTGRDLDGSTIGVAYVGVVCASSANSYGLSQRYPVNPSNPIIAPTVVLTAHEIGHNFAGRHVNQVTTEIPADIETPCDNSIMEASVGSGMSFCPFSRSQIIGFANVAATCLQNSATGPPVFPSCGETPIDFGVLANGALASSDCRSPSRGVGFFADRYSFQGTAGQRLTITMSRSGGTLAPYVYLIGPSGYAISQNGNGNSSSAISVSGAFTLPDTGKYLIEATSLVTAETGSYTVNVTLAGCTLSASPISQHFPAGGGNGTINVTATGGGCGPSYEFIKSPTTAAWLSPQVTSGTGSQVLNFTVAANTDSAGRRAFLLVGSATNDFTGGLRIPITQSGTSPDCSLTPIGYGQTVGGTLNSSSCQSPIRGNNFYSDRYVFNAAAGQQVSISMSSANAPNTDTFISLIGPNGVVVLNDDDSGGGQTNSRIPGGTGFLTLGLPGTYIIEASLFAANQTGSYTLTLTANGAPPITPPTILTEQGTNVVAAVDSVTHVRGPFTVTTPLNFSADGQRRIIFFTTDLGLSQGASLSGLSVIAQGTPLTVEAAGPWNAVSGMSYIVVRLTGLTPGTKSVIVTINGVNSTNSPTITIQ